MPVGRQVVFQPVVDLTTGRVVAHEALTRPEVGTVDDLLAHAAVQGRANAVDLELALTAIRSAGGVLTPVHVNLRPATVMETADLPEILHAILAETGRRPHELVIELTEQEAIPDLITARRRCAALRTRGYTIAIDDVGNGHASLRLIASLRPQIVKADREIIADLADSDESSAMVEALLLYCRRIGAQLIAEGIETEAQLSVLRALGVPYGQGNLLAVPASAPSSEVVLPPVLPGVSNLRQRVDTGPRMQDLMRRASTAPTNASGEDVRTLFSADEELLTVVLVDEIGRPVGAIHRSHFMVAASGPFGHALNARRSAMQHATKPRVVAPDAPVQEAVGLVASRGTNHVYDDLVVVDPDGRCRGVVRVYDLLTVLHHAQLDTALATNALTGLPSGRVVNDELRERLRGSAGAVAHWIDVDDFSHFNNRLGFAGGDALIQAMAALLQEIASMAPDSWLGHIGGDDFLLVTSRADAEAAISALVDRLPDAEDGTLPISIASLDCPPHSISDPEDVSRQLAPIKRMAKSASGVSWAVGVAGLSQARLRLGGRAIRAV